MASLDDFNVRVARRHTFANEDALHMARHRRGDGRLHLQIECQHIHLGVKCLKQRAFIALITESNTVNNPHCTTGQRYLPQTGSPFLISAPSLTLTSTTTPDIGAPTEPGSAVAFSRETVSTAEFLSSTETART